jgi:hypothetical protein
LHRLSFCRPFNSSSASSSSNWQAWGSVEPARAQVEHQPDLLVSITQHLPTSCSSTCKHCQACLAQQA